MTVIIYIVLFVGALALIFALPNHEQNSKELAKWAKRHGS